MLTAARAAASRGHRGEKVNIASDHAFFVITETGWLHLCISSGSFVIPSDDSTVDTGRLP